MQGRAAAGAEGGEGEVADGVGAEATEEAGGAELGHAAVAAGEVEGEEAEDKRGGPERDGEGGHRAGTLVEGPRELRGAGERDGAGAEGVADSFGGPLLEAHAAADRGDFVEVGAVAVSRVEGEEGAEEPGDGEGGEGEERDGFERAAEHGPRVASR